MRESKERPGRGEGARERREERGYIDECSILPGLEDVGSCYTVSPSPFERKSPRLHFGRR
jgi:hypothetical protein